MASCAHEERQRRRAETGRLSHAVDLLREANGPDKPALLSALRVTPCTFDRACELKKLCVNAYELHIEAVDGVRAARKAVERDPKSGADAAKLAVLSQKKLEVSRDLQLKCVALQGALGRELGLR